MTLLELKQKRAELLASAKAIMAGSKAAGKADLTAEETASVNAKLAEAATLKTQIDQLEAAAKAAADVAALDAELGTTQGRVTIPDGQQLQPVERPAFRSLGEQLLCIRNAEIGRGVDPRLMLGPSGAGAGVDSDGAYLIQTDTMAGIIKRMFEMGQILSRVRRIPISSASDSVTLNLIDESSRATGSRWGGVQVYWANEADSATAKKPKFKQAKVELAKLIGLAYMTDELLQDASAVQAIFTQAFSEEMTFVFEDCVIRGTGAGQPAGLIGNAATVSVAKETGQAAATVVYENVNKMFYRLLARNRANAVWFVNQDVEPQLNKMTLNVGTGGVPVYMPPGGVSTSPYGTLFGRPVVPVEYCATVGTVGDIILADLSEYLMVEKGGIETASSIHVKFINHEQTFRWVWRVNGRPLWNSKLTPYKGANDLSPFVTLDTRV